MITKQKPKFVAVHRVRMARSVSKISADTKSALDKPKFETGKIVVTSKALASLNCDEIINAIYRHRNGDWGEVSTADKLANENAITSRVRLRSAYFGSSGVVFWIVTKADRSCTRVLLPSEY